MSFNDMIGRWINRFRYPASLPEDIATDLGIALPTTLSFSVLIDLLSSSSMRPTRLKKFMSRRQAEGAFHLALKKEVFSSCSLFSYYFSKGWVVIALYFDEGRLQRALLQCPACERREGIELPLEEESLRLAGALARN